MFVLKIYPQKQASWSTYVCTDTNLTNTIRHQRKQNKHTGKAQS
jgi:hypothetical protein